MTTRTLFVLLVVTAQCAAGAGRVDVRAYGAHGDGIADDTAAIQAAIDDGAANGKTVVVPAGTYSLHPMTEIAGEDESYVTRCAIIMRSHMHVEAMPGATFRIRDGASTDASPLSMGMFCTDSILADVSIRGLVMDMNGANNPISPNRADASLDPAGQRYALWNQSHILVSGTGRTDGVPDPAKAARISDVVLENDQFLNTPGVCAITLAQSNVPGATLGRRWLIRNNLFFNNGLDTSDHSTIFGWADDVLVVGNTFLNPTMQSGLTGGKVAYEVHGANQRFLGNHVSNYMRGMWISSNLTSPATDIIVANNTFAPLRLYGIDFFRESALSTAIKRVIISQNVFGFDDSSVQGEPPGMQKAAVQLNATFAVRNVLIANNTASKVGSAVGSVFAVVATRSGGESHDHVRITGNSAAGFGGGVLLRTADRGLGVVEIDGNNFSDITRQGPFAPIGIYFGPYSPPYAATAIYESGARVTYLGMAYRSLQGSNSNHPPDTSAAWWTVDAAAADEPATSYLGLWNNVVGGGASEVQYGVYLRGQVNTLYLGPQTILGATVADYDTGGVVASRLSIAMPSLPISAAWAPDGIGTIAVP